jgi:hypothetical protein
MLSFYESINGLIHLLSQRSYELIIFGNTLTNTAKGLLYICHRCFLIQSN